MLVCTTLKVGKPCAFMNKKGCSYNGGRCHSIVDACDGCDQVEEHSEIRYCRIFAEPSAKWSMGRCNMATHVDRGGQSTETQRLNPLKASKRNQRLN